MFATKINTYVGTPNLLNIIDNPDTPKQTIPYWSKNTLNENATIRHPSAKRKYLLAKSFLSTFSKILFIFLCLNFLNNILHHFPFYFLLLFNPAIIKSCISPSNTSVTLLVVYPETLSFTKVYGHIT